jgi:hypothetical protein
MRKITKSDLAKYTKDELIEILNEVVFLADPFQRNGYLERAMGEARYKRQMRLIDEAHQHAQRAYDARSESFKLLEPYEGKKYSEVPLAVLSEIAELMEQAQKEDASYERLQKEIDEYGKNA